MAKMESDQLKIPPIKSEFKTPFMKYQEERDRKLHLLININ